MSPRTHRKFRRLQAELAAADLDRPYLARLLGYTSRAYIDKRMCGLVEWSLSDMYALMDLLRWPYDRMHELFPKDGIAAGAEEPTEGKPKEKDETAIRCPQCGAVLELIATTHLVMASKR